MSINIKTTGAAPAGGLQLQPRLPVYGVTKRGLVNFMAFDDAAPVTAYKDQITGGTQAPAVGAGGVTPNSLTALAGGGLHCVGRYSVPFKSTINNAAPWTIMFGQSFVANGAGLSNGRTQYLFSGISAGAIAGLTAYISLGSTFTSATVVGGITIREYESGGGGVLGTSPSPANFVYGAGLLIVVVHNGAGSGTLNIWRAGAIIATLAFAPNEVAQRGTGGVDNITYMFGGSLQYDCGDSNLEAMGIYNVALTNAEQALNFAAIAALAALPARNRAWS